MQHPLQAGAHEVIWNAEGMASGVYLVRLTVEGMTDRNVCPTGQGGGAGEVIARDFNRGIAGANPCVRPHRFSKPIPDKLE